jgi:hypothetical protein
MHVFTRRGAGYREGRALWLLKAVVPAGWDWQCGDASWDEVQNDAQKQYVCPAFRSCQPGEAYGQPPSPRVADPGTSRGRIVFGLTGDLLVETSLFRCNQVDSLSLSKYFRRTFCNERLYANRQTNPHHDRRGSSGL